MHREAERISAEVDLVAEQIGLGAVGIAFGLLPACIEPRRQRIADRNPQPGHDHGPDGPAVCLVLLPEDRAVRKVDKFARLAVAPIEDAEAPADVGLESGRRGRPGENESSH